MNDRRGDVGGEADNGIGRIQEVRSGNGKVGFMGGFQLTGNGHTVKLIENY